MKKQLSKEQIHTYEQIKSYILLSANWWPKNARRCQVLREKQKQLQPTSNEYMSNRKGKGDEVRGCLRTFFPPFRFLHYPLGIIHSSSAVQTIRIWPLYVYKYLTKRFIVLSNQIIEGTNYTRYLGTYLVYLLEGHFITIIKDSAIISIWELIRGLK